MNLEKTSMMLALSCCALLVTACQPQEAPLPQVKFLSEAEAAAIFKDAKSVERVGEPSIKIAAGENTTVVTTTQVFRINRPVGGAALMLGSCGGSCKVTVEGGTLNQCVTSGCAPDGAGCTPLVCSGSCTLSSQCKREGSVGIFSASPQ